MTPDEPNLMEPDYRLTRFYTEAEDSTVSPYTPIFTELQGLKSRYSKPQVIARGGLKQILRVFDMGTGRNVAMAKLLPDAPPEMYEPFLREARLTALLEHPYIIAIHDIGVGTDGLPYFTMELKTGDSLGEIIRQLGNGNPDYLARYDRRSLLVIFIKICDAVAYAHSRHVLHLDLKPENVQVGDFGEVILCDWGLGEIIGADAETKFDELLLNPDLLNNMTLSGSIRGTPGYMAPEQVDDLESTERTDIYSLGAIFYSILTCAPPVAGTKDEMFEKTRKGDILSPRTRFPELDIPQSLDAVVMQAMALAPSGRYSSADELSRELRHYISGFATSAERASAGKLFQLLYRRNRRSFIMLGISFLTVATVVVFSIHELKIKERHASQARERAETALWLYQVEREHSGAVTGEYMADLIDVNRSFIDQNEFVQALAKIERAVVKDPTNKKAWLQKASTHFMMQQFGAAAESFKKAGFKGKNSHLALEYAQAKPDGALLSGAELAGLVYRMDQESLRDRMMMYDSSARTDREEHLLVVKAVLAKLNPEWHAEGFKYDPYSRSLTLSGSGLKVLSSGLNTAKCVLRTLNLRSLDIHGSSFSNLKNVMVLHVENLDIRQTGVVDIGTVKKMPYLKKLTVSPGRYPPGILRQLRQKIEVVEQD